MKKFVLDRVLVGLGLALAAAGCGSSSSGPSGATAGDGGGGFVPGQPITGLAKNTWTWVPIEGAKCRDGSATGIGVSPGTSSDKTMIFLEGGGACFNDTTCGLLNPQKYGSGDFATFMASGGEGSQGIFSRSDTNNAVADWNFVYVPYCTGDIHAGDNVTGGDAGSAAVNNQHFVGYANVGLDLQRVVPTFGSQTQVLLTGISAGGFGASANYAQVSRAYPSLNVVLIDDSGPPMEDPYESKCQQQLVTQLWGLDKTLLSDCGSACSDPASYYLDYAKQFGMKYPKSAFGLIESEQDMIITSFFGFGTDDGKDDCNGTLLTPESGPMFTQGLQDIRSKLAGNPNFGSFIFPGSDHTSLVSAFDSRMADGEYLYDWVKKILSGTVTNVGLDEGDGGMSGGDSGTSTPSDAAPPTEAGSTPADAGTPDAADASGLTSI